ncbi:two-component system response regulator [Mesorhizobium sp. Root554]|uniref:response regulator transcription factor n=1 Tax=unclassified Mesorhizobium TaxID=325217 RepID=UPI0006FAEC22|nr:MULTISPECIES: response regulator [unclassified Mesorhizobium]KQZ13383.1 two-component system response regulator [Mesorhizobium sp. Root1471]KQZ35896.1 two-component system response regulator [Mesorhizobium sp. Root554]
MSKTRVLIVEDEPHIVESLSFILQRADFEVDTALDGTEALRRLSRHIYSVLILDIMLPGISGLDVLRAVRSDRALDRLPVIVLTAKGQAADRSAAEAFGATAFITKPFSNTEIVERVCQLAAGVSK